MAKKLTEFRVISYDAKQGSRGYAQGKFPQVEPALQAAVQKMNSMPSPPWPGSRVHVEQYHPKWGPTTLAAWEVVQYNWTKTR